MVAPDLDSIRPCEDECGCPQKHYHLLIPDYDDEIEEEQAYPGGIKPGRYNWDALVNLLRYHKGNPDSIQFIADMLDGLEEMEQFRLRMAHS